MARKQTHSLLVQSFLYDFTTDGGALGDINTGIGCINTGIQLQRLSVVIGMSFFVINPVTSGGAAIIDIGNISNSFRSQPLPVPSTPNVLPNNSGSSSVTTSLDVLMGIAAATLTGGKFYCFIEYYTPFTDFN